MTNALALLKERIGVQVSELESHMALIQNSIVKGQQSIDMLTDYIRQYSEKLVNAEHGLQCQDEAANAMITGVELRAHNQFAARLMTALAAQVKQNDQNRQYLARASENLKVLKTRQKTLEQVLDKRLQAREEQAMRLAQKDLDELATLRHAHRLQGKHTPGGLA
ncbi:MAG TPA: flagellar export protein FliJ [Limnobacter sp.]|nr:flagellar export protein FliJ [Limnobacter sp.]